MEKSAKIGKSEMKENFNPFPGLRPFTIEESDLFFGREGQSDEILEKLIKNKFITVIGASGSGKSSLIYCGIIPRLMAEGKGDSWKILSLRPGNDPIGNLVNTFSEEINNESLKSGLESVFRSTDAGLDKAVEALKLNKGKRVLLMVDQFEELFRFKDSQRGGSLTSDSKQFVDILVNGLSKSKADIHVIITMRSDFIGECAHFQGLTSLINSSNYLVPPMTRENYDKAITGPIEYVGGKVDKDLVNSLLNEIGSRIDQLPVLQHAMMRTWSHWQKIGHKDIPVSKGDYDSVGQMKEAMSRHADEAFEELDLRGKEICEVLFKTITEKGSDNKGIRHPTRVETIASIANCTNAELYTVIDVYRLSGRSFLTPGPGVDLNPDTVIDVSHESLMRIWDRLAIWVEEEAASVQMYLRLSESSELFQAGKASLWRLPDLQLAINWRNDNNPTLNWAERYHPAFERAMVYLQTSEKEYLAEEENKIRAQKRRQRRSRITAIILGTAAIVSVLFMLYAFIQQIEAERNRSQAEENRVIAEQNEADAIDQADTAKRQAIIAEADKDTALYNAAIAESQRIRAEAGEFRAETEAERANREAEAALKSEADARHQEALAIAASELSAQRRMLAIGKTMAVKSVQAIGQGDLQGLLAYQAYLFNRRNNGKDNEADIYMGLYHVGKSFGRQSYRQLNGHQGTVRSISFLSDKNIMFTSGTDGKILKWNSDSWSSETVFQGSSEIMEVLATSTDGKTLAAGSDQSRIMVFPTNGSGISYELNGHTDKINALAFTPDNKYLFSAAIDGSLYKWDLNTREYTKILSGGDKINSLDVSPKGNILAAAEENGTVSLWNVETMESLDPLNSEKGPVTVVRFNEEGVLAVGYRNGTVDLWDVESTTITAKINAHEARVTDIRFNTRSRQLATSSTDQFVKLWNLDDLAEPPIALDDNGTVIAISFSPDGKVIVSGGELGSEDENLLVRPTHVDYMVADICAILNRNFTQDEWRIHVGEDIDYEVTCDKEELGIQVIKKN